MKSLGLILHWKICFLKILVKAQGRESATSDAVSGCLEEGIREETVFVSFEMGIRSTGGSIHGECSTWMTIGNIKTAVVKQSVQEPW